MSFSALALMSVDSSILNEVLELFHFRELLNEFLHLLRLTLVGEHHRVIRLHQDGIAQTHHGNRRATIFAAGVKNNVTGSVHVNEIGHGAIAFSVRLEMPRERRPRPKIVPLENPRPPR